MARPKKKIDWKKVDELLFAGCMGTEIAPHFDMHPMTFYNKVEQHYKIGFTEYSQQKKAQGDSCLRKKQYDKAMAGDTTLLIWLGKQRLDQKENHEVSVAPETIKQFSSLMDHIARLQSEIVITHHSEK